MSGVASAQYWIDCARRTGQAFSQRALCYENAINHLVNEIHALRTGAPPSFNKGDRVELNDLGMAENTGIEPYWKRRNPGKRRGGVVMSTPKSYSSMIRVKWDDAKGPAAYARIFFQRKAEASGSNTPEQNTGRDGNAERSHKAAEGDVPVVHTPDDAA